MRDISRDWSLARLAWDMGHFQGEIFPAGTTVKVRPYDRDPHYLEIRLPDGVRITESERAIVRY